jgi:hypothetical protein
MFYWFLKTQRKVDDDWVRRCTLMEVEGKRSRGRPRKTWRDVTEDDLERHDLCAKDAMDRCLRRGRVHGANQRSWDFRVDPGWPVAAHIEMDK